MPSMSSGRRPASSMAFRAASTANAIGCSHQPTADARRTDPGDRDLVLELVARLRHGARLPHGRVLGRQRARLGVAGGLEQRHPHVVVVLEGDLHPHAHEHVVRVAADDVGGEPDAVVLLDGDDGHAVRRREARDPGVVVDRDPGNDGPPGDRRRCPARWSSSRGTPATAGAAAHRTRSTAGSGACRRPPTSRRTRSPR